MTRVLVTGGAGYIGSHTCVELLAAGCELVVLDNLSNSSAQSLARVEQISGKAVRLVQADVRDRAALTAVFQGHNFDAVIHFAGLKAVGESTQQPLAYYQTNIAGTLNLCQVMAEFGVKRLVFSSSATVYGDPQQLPITEDMPLSTTNPYGYSKLAVENILRDLYRSDGEWDIALLRYFNPVGAHPSGLIGEDPRGIPSNLMPFVSQVAVGKRQQLAVFGDDYPTVDGTGVRDYIHVQDLAAGHLAALQKLQQGCGLGVWNLGTGEGYSVLQIVEAFKRISGREIPYRIVERRPGDIAACYADPSKAAQQLNWRASHGLEQMIEDSWRWQKNNPEGYGTD